MHHVWLLRYYARGMATLILACGLLALPGVAGRLASLAAIFCMFYLNHMVRLDISTSKLLPR